MALRAGPKSWDVFRRAFYDMSFPKEKREENFEKFVNFCQGDISTLDYSLKFPKLSEYSPSLVTNPKNEIRTL